MESEIRCVSCGYQLRGLSQFVCPECGRAFDPTDPKTFDSRPPGWRRRRRIRRAITLVVVALALVPFFPRKLLKGEITFQCGACGAKQSMYRWEPLLPNWLGARMPGVHWRTGLRRAPDDTRQACAQHSFDNIAVNVVLSFGSSSLRGTYGPKDIPVLFGVDASGVETNGLIVTPDTACDAIWHLMAPGNSGAGITFAPKEN